jgi:hypothetical protein
MSEKKKKKLIRVQGLGGRSPYGHSSMNFSFVSSPADGRRQVCSIVTCREYVNRTVWAAYNGKSVSNYTHAANPPMDFDRLRLLIVHDPDGVEAFKRKLFNGKAALNLFEKLAGWKKSTITTVKHSDYSNAWLLTGPQEWISQPQLLSLATWILRLASFAGPLNVESYSHLEKSFYDIKNKRNTGSNSDQTTYASKFWDKSYILVKHHKEIFKGMAMSDAWSPESSGNFGVYSGFMSFCDKSASYSDKVRAAQSRFHDLCKTQLPRKNSLIKGR